MARVASLGEMTASIAHEVNQPLAAVVANGHACLRWLSASPPNLPKAVEAAERIVKDGKDAGEVVRRVRALFKRTAVERVRLDLDEVIGEVLRLLDSYPARKHVSLDVVLAPDLPPVFADRVQLQQLVLNLMLNALEALEPVSGRVKQLSVRSTRAEGHRPSSRSPTTGSASTIPLRHLNRSSPRSRRGWAWGWRSAGRSSLLMTARCRPSATLDSARRSRSRCPFSRRDRHDSRPSSRVRRR